MKKTVLVVATLLFVSLLCCSFSSGSYSYSPYYGGYYYPYYGGYYYPYYSSSRRYRRYYSSEPRYIPSDPTETTYNRSYTLDNIETPAGFVQLHVVAYDKTSHKEIAGVVMVNPDAITSILQSEDGEVSLCLNFGVGYGSDTTLKSEVSSITISETYDELVSLIENARKSITAQ